MSDCYLCGAYIERGRRYRREVHTGTSTRFYMTRWGGTSIGLRTGPRTVCAQCADELDHLRAGGFGRCLMYGLGYVVSAYVGFQLVMSDSPWLGLMFLIGVPTLAVAWVIEAVRRSTIRESRLGYEQSSSLGSDAHKPLQPPIDARRENESVAEWVERALQLNPELSRRLVEGYANHHPPAVGVPLASWIKAWPEWNPEWDPMNEVNLEVFRPDDTVESWADRIAKRIESLTDESADDLSAGLMAQTKYRRPRVGETLDDFRHRFSIWFARVDCNLDLTSAASAIQAGEGFEAWVERTAPLYLTLGDGACLEDLVPKLHAIASLCEPRSGETVAAWLERVKPAIEEAGVDCEPLVRAV